MYKKLKKFIYEPELILLYLIKKFSVLFPDKLYLKIVYRLSMHKPLNLLNPITFNEKLQWLKLHNRNAEHVKFVDKIAVKEFVSSLIGCEYIIPTLGIYSHFNEIKFEKLPNRFVLKCTHDSGGVVICNDSKQFDQKAAKRKLNASLKRNYYYSTREWPYKQVTPKLICEENISSKEDELLDFKFMVFNGKVKVVFVCSARSTSGGLRVDFFDTNWNLLPFNRKYLNSQRKIARPANLETMIYLSEKIAKELVLPFVRIDFYEINNRVYFGEITLYPGGGWEPFNPEKWDLILGDWITL